MLDRPVASALNRSLDSRLRVEIDMVIRTSDVGQVNLTELARQIQATLDALESAPVAELGRSKTTEEGDFRLVWHARERRAGEEGTHP